MSKASIYEILKLDTNLPVVEFENVSISQKLKKRDIEKVHNVSFKIPRGQRSGFVGESSSGKSTIGLTIASALSEDHVITDGCVKIYGRDITTFSASERRLIQKDLIKFVDFDSEFRFDPRRIVYEQAVILLPEITRERLKEILHDWEVPAPEKVIQSFPIDLTPLIKQRLSLALIFAAEPDLVILDEPTRHLDLTAEGDTFSLIQKHIHQKPVTVLFLSHQLGLVSNICKNVFVMYQGEIIESGQTSKVFRHMSHPYTQGLLHSLPLPGTDKHSKPVIPMLPATNVNKHEGCRFIDRCPHAILSVCEYGQINMYEGAFEGHQVRCRRWKEIESFSTLDSHDIKDRVDIGAIVLSINNVTKEYTPSEPPANFDISFDARIAETVAIVGETGSGKTTLAKLLLGLETVTSGSIRLAGREISNETILQRSQFQRQNLQAIFTDFRTTLNPALTIETQLRRTILATRHEKNETKQYQLIMEYFEKADIHPDICDKFPADLSGSECQKIAIIRAFITGAKVIIADEPLHALDASEQASLARLMARLQREQRTTLIYISSDLSFVRYFADTVVIMYRGQIMEYGDVHTVFQAPFHPYVEALVAATPNPQGTCESFKPILKGEIFPTSRQILQHACPFHRRCHKAVDGLCNKKAPQLEKTDYNHFVRCHVYMENLAGQTQK